MAVRKHPEDPKTTEARVKALDYLQELGGMEGGEMCSDVMYERRINE